MKLNHDCVRDLLLYLEENLDYTSRIYSSNINLQTYSIEEITYTTERLIEAEYLNCITIACIGSQYKNYMFKSITYKGHQYLDTVRDDGIWKETKKKFSKFASVSLPIAQEIASSLLKSKLGLP